MDVSIVIPAYNEAARIQRTLEAIDRYVAASEMTAEVIIVNDGSADGTRAIGERFAADHPYTRLLHNERNLGKGGSVRRGMLAASGDYVFFMDADLSVPIEQLGSCWQAMVRDGHAILIGSRRVAGAVIARRQPKLREYLGRAFTLLARTTLHPQIVDFTCGFKGFRRDVARALFSLQRRPDWAFDAEILHLARLLRIPVHQQPVTWEHRDGSRVRFPRDIVRTLSALVDIRWHSRSVLRHRPDVVARLSRS